MEFKKKREVPSWWPRSWYEHPIWLICLSLRESVNMEFKEADQVGLTSFFHSGFNDILLRTKWQMKGDDDHVFSVIILLSNLLITPIIQQTEKAYQKQDGIFIGRKRLLGKKTKNGMRYYKSIGLGFKTPKEAIEGSYVDKKCPFTGNVSIRGRILKAMVISTKMKRTIVIRRDYLQYVSKYRRFEKRHKNVSVHCSPCFLNVREGDVVTVGQCRPLAKTVRFNVLEHQPSVNKVSYPPSRSPFLSFPSWQFR